MDGAQRAGTWWSQVWDVKITRFVTRIPAAAADLPVLREGECRAGTWAVLPGQRVLRARSQHRGGAAVLLRQRAV
jgi:hypothetical protein